MLKVKYGISSMLLSHILVVRIFHCNLLLYLVIHYSAPPALPVPQLQSGAARGAPQHSVPKSCRRADANVMLLSLGTLKNDPVIMTGDPVHCSQCKVHLSHVSRLETAEEEGQRNWTW